MDITPENEVVVDEFKPTVVEHIIIRDLSTGEVIVNQRGSMVPQFFENHLNDQDDDKSQG